MQKNSLALSLARFVTHFPWLVCFLTLFIVSALTAGVAKLDFKTDYRVFFGPENPQLIAFNAIQNTYNKSDNVMFVIEPENGDIFTPEGLQIIADLTQKAWQIPYTSRVDSITNFQNTLSIEDDLVVSDLVAKPDQLNISDIETIKQIALNEPLLANRLISLKGHVSGINVTVQLPDNNALAAMEVTEKARELATSITKKHPDIKIHLTGIVMMNNAFIEAAMHDNMTLAPLMFSVVILVLWLCFRSISATLAVVVLILLSIAPALGLFGWMDNSLTLASAPAPIIILTMAVADCVHFLASMLHHLRNGLDKKAAIQDSLRINFQPMFLTSITTAIGFLSLNFSDAPPYRDLGNVVAIGVVCAFILTVTFLPAFMTLLPVRTKFTHDLGHSNFNKLAQFVIHRRKFLLVANVVIAITFSVFAGQNELNDELVKYFDETIEFRKATDFLNQNMGGIYTIELAVNSGETGGINEPKFLNEIESLSKWLRNQPEVVHVNTLTDTFKRLNKNMHGDDNNFYKLPEERNLAAQYLLTYEMSLPYGLDLNDQVNLDKSSTRIIATLREMSSIEMLELEDRIRQSLTTHYQELDVAIASPGLMFSHIGKRNIISLIGGAFLALTVISFILIAAFRSVKLGLISLIPNLAPAGIAFGVWGLINGQINLGLSIVAGMTLGIVVDDTVHFISKYERARKEGQLSSEDAVRHAFSTVGNAMWITSAVLVCGFIVLSFSHFSLNAGMGQLTALTITIALLMDLLFLPPLLMFFSKRKADMYLTEKS
ncbi:MAG: MMPL family transporter [Methylicorpusculum sp.]|uniref:efflux RND transporter permease subunit n=2 Tax=Methylicorpusculum sp. TaxID=2713644 RepID=UPI00271CAE88|nr:MMPL family transporter [Methylicorpusculum sp.]MDO8941198.1 MMPL family transporter [Methylicorpusculum sp.]